MNVQEFKKYMERIDQQMEMDEIQKKINNRNKEIHYSQITGRQLEINEYDLSNDEDDEMNNWFWSRH